MILSVVFLRSTSPLRNDSRIVSQILAAKRADPAADTSKLEAEIDRHVYALYGLTDAEIALVEGSTAKS